MWRIRLLKSLSSQMPLPPHLRWYNSRLGLQRLTPHFGMFKSSVKAVKTHVHQRLRPCINGPLNKFRYSTPIWHGTTHLPLKTPWHPTPITLTWFRRTLVIFLLKSQRLLTLHVSLTSARCKWSTQFLFSTTKPAVQMETVVVQVVATKEEFETRLNKQR